MFRKLADYGIPIKYEKKLMKVEEQNEMVILHFADGTSARHRFAVGADGIHSTARNYIDTTSKPYYGGTYVIYGMMPEDQLHSKLKNGRKLPNTCVMFGLEGSFIFQPTDYEGKEVAFIASITLPDLGREGWNRLANDKEEMRQLLISTYCGKGWPEEVEVVCRETPDKELKPWAAHLLPTLSSWKSPSGRVVLVGDAGHAISPSGAQGGAMLFEDSETLAHALSMADESSLMSVLQKWEDHRKNRLQLVIDMTNLIIKLRLPSSNWLLQAAKEWFIWGLMKYRGPKGQNWLYGYDCVERMSKL